MLAQNESSLFSAHEMSKGRNKLLPARPGKKSQERCRGVRGYEVKTRFCDSALSSPHAAETSSQNLVLPFNGIKFHEKMN